MRHHDTRPRYQVVVAAIAIAATLPILLVVASILTPSRDVWAFLVKDTDLKSMVISTISLGVVVVIGSVVLGAGIAWVVGRHTFPGHKWFSWCMVLPLAVPAYVSGFTYIGLLDHPGPVQQSLRAIFGPEVWFPEVRSFWLCALVLIFAYFPYPYILTRAALREQSQTTYQAARALGATPWQATYRVLLPLARPSLAAGGMVVAMETLTDFATVRYFNIQTVSVGIHKVWVGMYNREAASELAGLVMLFALAVIIAERIARGGARFHQHAGGPQLMPTPLTGTRALAATVCCVVVLLITFGVPLIQLIAWSRPSEAIRSIDGRFISYVTNSALISVFVAVLCVVTGLVLASATRLAGGRYVKWLASAATVGYAVPGPVVAIGVLIVLAAVNTASSWFGWSLGSTLVTGTIGGLLYAYVIRFLALAWSSVDAGLEKVAPSITLAALSLGARPSAVMRRVHTPLLRPGLGVALVLVAVDTLKELPIMLLLRPFGFETLAVWVYQLASESRWTVAGPPALTIVAIAVVPIVVIFRKTLATPEPVSAPTPADESLPALSGDQR